MGFSAAHERKNSSFVGLATLILLECLVLLQAFFAYRDGFLTVSQMQTLGVQRGLPFVWHFAMWSDLLLISPLCAYLVARHWKQWGGHHVVISVLVSVSISVPLHWLYTLSATPEAHVHDHALTSAGFVHLIYMGLTIAIFTTFFLFTPSLRPLTLWIISTLIMLHVFIGTHMLLGLINLHTEFDWYPGQPLRSFIGWATIALVVIGLSWRSFGGSIPWDALAAPNERFPWLNTPLRFFEFWTLHNFTNTERYLKALDYMASYVGFGTFFAVFLTKVQLATAHEGGVLQLHNIKIFVQDTALPCMLILLFGFIYFAGRQSVRMELAFGAKLFPPDHIPDDWGGPKGRVLAFLAVVGFLVLFVALTWFADNILITSSIMFVLAVNDWNTRYQINKAIRRYFSDPRFAPLPEEPQYQTIMRRRSVAEGFLFRKPHLWKETARFVGCGIALGFALSGYLQDDHRFSVAAYLILIVVLVVNEWVTLRWRVHMFWQMQAVDRT